MDKFGKLGSVQAIGRFWNSLTGPQKLVTAIFVASSIVLLCVASVMAARPNMEVLFSGLQAEDAGAIVAKLQERKVEYELDGGGSVIKVPAKNVHDLRLRMAGDGLPQGGSVGFEIFDKTNLGMTEFAQRLNYQRALQGELTRTIMQIDRVQNARVHIAIPEDRLFDRREKHPQASVVLKLSAGSTLDGDQVAGIVHLVSSSVEGMKPNNVTVVDTRGNVLSEGGDEASPFNARLSASQLETRQAYERQTQKNIESMLERVLGPNKAIVRVSAKLDFDQKETNSEVFEPVKETAQTGSAADTGKAVDGYRGVLLSERRTDETYGPNRSGGSSPTASVGGIPGKVGGKAGVTPNTSPGSEATVSEVRGGYHRSESSAEYQVTKTTQRVVQTPGAVQLLSVAVMLDGKVDVGQIPAIQRVVEASAGIDPKRGDRVIVESVPFDDKTAKQEEKEMAAIASKQTYLSIGKTAGGVLLLLGFLFYLKGLLKGISLSPAANQGAGNVQLGPAFQQQSAATAYAPVAATPIDGGGSTAGGGAPRDPKEVAQVVREWLQN